MAVAIFRRALLNGDAAAEAARDALRAATAADELDDALGTKPAAAHPAGSNRIAYLISAGTRQQDRDAALRARVDADLL